MQYYKNAPDDKFIPGLMHSRLGGYHVGDIEFSAAFDIDERKVGRDLERSDLPAAQQHREVRRRPSRSACRSSAG